MYETPFDLPERLALSPVEGGFAPIFGGVDDDEIQQGTGEVARSVGLPDHAPLAWSDPTWEPAVVKASGYFGFDPFYPFAASDGVIAAVFNRREHGPALRLLRSEPSLFFNGGLDLPLPITAVALLEPPHQRVDDGDLWSIVVARGVGDPASPVTAAHALSLSAVVLDPFRDEGERVEHLVAGRACGDRPLAVAMARLATHTMVVTSNGAPDADCSDASIILPPTALRVTLLSPDGDVVAQGGVAMGGPIVDVRLAASEDGAWIGVLREDSDALDVLAIGDDATPRHVVDVVRRGGEMAIGRWRDGFAVVETAVDGGELRVRLHDATGALANESVVGASGTPFVGPPAVVASSDGRSLAVASFGSQGGAVEATSSPVIVRRARCDL